MNSRTKQTFNIAFVTFYLIRTVLLDYFVIIIQNSILFSPQTLTFTNLVFVIVLILFLDIKNAKPIIVYILRILLESPNDYIGNFRFNYYFYGCGILKIARFML